MVYKWYILLYATYHLLRKPKTTIDIGATAPSFKLTKNLRHPSKYRVIFLLYIEPQVQKHHLRVVGMMIIQSISSSSNKLRRQMNLEQYFQALSKWDTDGRKWCKDTQNGVLKMSTYSIWILRISTDSTVFIQKIDSQPSLYSSSWNVGIPPKRSFCNGTITNKLFPLWAMPIWWI